MPRKPVMAGNWKMNNTTGEAVVLAQEILNRYYPDWLEFVDVVVCPPFIDLKSVSNVFVFEHAKIGLGAQDVFWESSGAYTGEISPVMLKEVGCSFCIIGHSERRTMFGETNEFVNRKAKALIAAGITPIICVGESLAVRDEGTTNEFVAAQVDAAFAGIEEAEASKCIIAYEPIWAIGTGRTATPEQADEVCGVIRAKIAELYSDGLADDMRILYGGSMNVGNVEGLIACPNIDGGLIGGAALKADSFCDLIKACM